MMTIAAGGGRDEALWIGGDRYGLGLVAPGSPGQLYGDVRAAAAICGDPWWSDAELRHLASEQGDAKALLHAYRAEKEGLLRHLCGTFAFALVDLDLDRVLLAIDRFGVETLRFLQTAGADVVFASITSSVCAHPLSVCRLSLQSVFDYFYADTIYAPATIYQDQKKLCPAQVVDFRNGSATATTYWQMPYADSESASKEALMADLRSSLRVAVRRSLEGKDLQRVGTFLSGGLDSSTITGLVREVAGRPIPSFTVGFADADFDETAFARVAAAHFDVPHHVFRLSDSDAFSLIERAPAAFDEPFLNLSCLPVFFCAHLAREHGVDVLIAGDGGDELFAGNKHYLWSKILDHYQVLPEALRTGVIEPLVLRLPPTTRIPILRTLRHWVDEARRPMPERRMKGIFSASSAFLELWTDDARQEIDPDRPMARMREIYFSVPSRSELRRYMSLDHRIVLADNDLRKVNVMCALAGVRVHYPFLDNDVASVAARVPPTLLIRGRQLRYFYKRAFADFLPAPVLSKKKHGFGPPYVLWLRRHQPLYELANDCIRDFARHGILQQKALQKMLDRPRDGPPSHLDDLAWQVMWLEMWLRMSEQTVTKGARPSLRSPGANII